MPHSKLFMHTTSEKSEYIKKSLKKDYREHLLVRIKVKVRASLGSHITRYSETESKAYFSPLPPHPSAVRYILFSSHQSSVHGRNGWANGTSLLVSNHRFNGFAIRAEFTHHLNWQSMPSH